MVAMNIKNSHDPSVAENNGLFALLYLTVEIESPVAHLWKQLASYRLYECQPLLELLGYGPQGESLAFEHLRIPKDLDADTLSREMQTIVPDEPGFEELRAISEEEAADYVECGASVYLDLYPAISNPGYHSFRILTLSEVLSLELNEDSEQCQYASIVWNSIKRLLQVANETNTKSRLVSWLMGPY